ncbi:MAG: hypothetical protein IKE77_07280 [Erysipelotrichaceae bacterium]|nr:hypothetical protein [Erysipelotrichaceae bacterium]
MRVLNIDTDVLRNSVSIAERANNEISEAMNLLNQITIHNDWICPQRDEINNYTMMNRERIRVIQNNSASFYSAIKESSNIFDETERENMNAHNNLDGIIARILSISPSTFGGTGFAGTFESAVNGCHNIASQSINMVNFQSLKEGLSL